MQFVKCSYPFQLRIFALNIVIICDIYSKMIRNLYGKFELNVIQDREYNDIQPKLLGYYQLNYGKPEKVLSLKYFQLPSETDYPLDLAKGYECNKFRQPEYTTVGLRLVLAWLITSEGQQFLKNNTQYTRVFTRRDFLTKLICSQVISKKHTILASRFNGDLYLHCVEDCENKVKTVTNYHQSSLLKHLFSDLPTVKPCPYAENDENISPAIIHHARLGKYQLIYSGAIQGIASDTQLSNVNDINVLRSCEFVMAKQIWKDCSPIGKHAKFVFYWLDSILANISKLYVGEKNHKGLVHKIECFPINDIPKMFNFEANKIFGYIEAFLNHLEDLMKDVNSLGIVYEIQFNGNHFSYRVRSGEVYESFISTEYMDFIKSH